MSTNDRAQLRSPAWWEGHHRCGVCGAPTNCDGDRCELCGRLVASCCLWLGVGYGFDGRRRVYRRCRACRDEWPRPTYAPTAR